MKVPHHFILSFIISLCITNNATAEEFTSLFNGKDLSGWKTDGNWVVQKDGSLMIDPKPGQEGWNRFNDYIFTEKKYGDFILEMEYKYPCLLYTSDAADE